MENIYKTTDINLAVYLFGKGFTVFSCKGIKSQKVRVIAFKMTAPLMRAVKMYAAGRAKVDPREHFGRLEAFMVSLAL